MLNSTHGCTQVGDPHRTFAPHRLDHASQHRETHTGLQTQNVHSVTLEGITTLPQAHQTYQCRPSRRSNQSHAFESSPHLVHCHSPSHHIPDACNKTTLPQCQHHPTSTTNDDPHVHANAEYTHAPALNAQPNIHPTLWGTSKARIRIQDSAELYDYSSS
jgi:hypothetical protein